MTRTNSPGDRLHIVLIPGFAGFDALGQLEYYAGVTAQFRQWRERKGHTRAVLHYFDNFPTAAVVTRAGRLQRYLARRIVRGEFQSSDAIALIGDSTGGLDIRRLLWDLAKDPGKQVEVDGPGQTERRRHSSVGTPRRFSVRASMGTNIADWLRSYALASAVVIAELRGTVAGSQMPVIHRLENRLACGASAVTDVDLMRALQDGLSEADAGGQSGSDA